MSRRTNRGENRRDRGRNDERPPPPVREATAARGGACEACTVGSPEAFAGEPAVARGVMIQRLVEAAQAVEPAAAREREELAPHAAVVGDEAQRVGAGHGAL